MTGRAGPTVVVPVKPWRLAKSRLGLGAQAQAALARAFALDVLTAISTSANVGRLVVVTAEIELSGAARRLGAVVLRDRPMLSPEGLNAAIQIGCHWAIARQPEAALMVVPADLPALTATVVDHTIDLLRPYERAYVPDATGSGTTFSWAARPELLCPRYGRGSATKHSAAGSHPVSEADPRARWDVDTDADLIEARHLGVGAHTAAVIEELRPSAHV